MIQYTSNIPLYTSDNITISLNPGEALDKTTAETRAQAPGKPRK